MDFRFNEGSIPLLVSMPHVGTDIPDDIAARMTPQALQKADTDWHLRELYGFLHEMDASVLSARWSRYAIDLNRPQEDTNLYPGQDTTGLLPSDTFHREPLYLPGREPDAQDVQQPPAALLGAVSPAAARGTGPAAARAWRAWCCGMPIPSPRACRAFLTASCPT